MRFRLSFLILLFFSIASFAEVRHSSRNLTPLSQPKGGRVAGRGSDAGSGGSTPSQESEPTVARRVTFLGPASGWGYVRTAAPYYTDQGKRLGELPGGTLFKYSEVRNSSKNSVLVCVVRRGDAWQGPVLIDCTDIAAYEGDPEKLDPRLVDDLGAYFTLLGRVEERKAALAEEALAANPHYESARQAQQAYQKSVEKAAAMEAEMNTLAGIRKTKALDALRAFKYEQVRIKAEADQEAQAYKRWKDAHPVDAAKLAADPQLRQLERELQAAKAKVADLVPE